MTIRVLTGDCREVLRTLPDESVHCVVTSPPYFGLRDYGTAQWDGGDSSCDHDAYARRRNAQAQPGSGSGAGNGGALRDKPRLMCECGARRVDNQIGLEPTPDAYVAELVAVFRDLRRVLRKDGTVFLNLGDSYAGSWGNQGRKDERGTQRPINGEMLQAVHDGRYPDRLSNTGAVPLGLKPKDLIGIPWRVAFALQADGWWLRQDIIWSKPNPMPESVRDRCTKAHEYLFLLAKSERYYFDQEAILEPVAAASVARLSQPSLHTQMGSDRVPGKTNGPMKAVSRTVDKSQYKAATIPGQQPHGYTQRNDGSTSCSANATERNKRSVWEVTTQPFSEAHFATFPPALIEPCILAGCPKECCASCGAPWVREVERERPDDFGRGTTPKNQGQIGQQQRNALGPPGNGMGVKPSITLGFAPSCVCGASTVPGTVLDPFGGAGTTGLVADRLQRNAILIELNPDYAAMARRRIESDAPLFYEAAE